MKIAAICTSDIPSNKANAIQVMKVMDALLALDHEVRLWSPGKQAADLPGIKQLFGMQKLPQLKWAASDPRWKRYDYIASTFLQALFWKPDLIYTWTLQSAVLGLMFRIPVILELHDRPTGKVGVLAFNRFVKKKGKKRLLLITDALRNALENEQQVDLSGEWVQIAPNGIDLLQYEDVPAPKVARESLQLEEKFTAVFTGHFYAGRGIELLFGLAQSVPEVNFLWVGGADDMVQSWRQRLDVAGVKNVTITGFVPQADLPLYQAAGDVLLMPYGLKIAGSSGGNSAEICSPMKMFDYLATGRPIISSELPVLHEILSEQNTVFCPAKNIESWANAIRDLFRNEQRCKQMGEHARKTAMQYTWQNRASVTLEEFEQAE
jgi:glycosyltransferase involved in cell wall biosynthesis